jgi:hypothetical protein
MGKKAVMISLDEFVHKRAKEKLLNISEICERAIITRLNLNKSDAPEESILMKCSICGDVVEDGFLCEETGKFFCTKTECNFNKVELSDGSVTESWRCKVNNVDHKHLRIPGYNGENMEIAKRIANKDE